MRLQEIEQAALNLPEQGRSTLVLALMETLTGPGADGSDEDVLRRDNDLEFGAVQLMLHEELVRQTQEARGR